MIGDDFPVGDRICALHASHNYRTLSGCQVFLYMKYEHTNFLYTRPSRLFMNIPVPFIQGPKALEVKGVCINYLSMGHVWCTSYHCFTI
jgi:hypothetical protein